MERRAARHDPMTKVPRRRDRPRERWLLTRKTWKYMSDAGRRLIPDGAQNRAEDVPRIEAYFQEVCAKEPRFLLWRKSSYPGALPRQWRKKRARGGSVRARSPSDDAPPPPPQRPTDLYIPHTSGGRFDIAKLRRDFFASPPAAAPAGYSVSTGAGANNSVRAPPAADREETDLVDLLRKHLKVEEEAPPSAQDTEELVRSLRAYLQRNAPADGDADPTRRALHVHIARYARTANRDQVVHDLLNDRNSLKRLYHDLRKPKPYRGARSGGTGSGPGGFGSNSFVVSGGGGSAGPAGGGGRGRSRAVRGRDGPDGPRSPPMSPPPLIEVRHESLEEAGVECGTQTAPIPEDALIELERAYRDKLEAATAPTSPVSPPPERRPARRRSSVDHDDVSQSVSDTIKRYLRMARKKSVDADKADRFKRINYDKNLRNIKPRAPGEVDDDGPHKGCQTEEGWILTYREMQFASAATTPTSPPPSFLSLVRGGGAAGTGTCSAAGPAGGMQKSRSSSSVVQSVSKRLWRTRSRSSSRAAAAWTPQGSCVWADGSGRCVRLTDTSLLTLSEVERRALQQAALARLHQLLGFNVKIPDENAVVATKPKRRAYLLKRKALTTGFFDQSRTKDADKEKENSTRSVFGVPLAQCVETERALRRQQHGGSRASLASLGAFDKGDDSESCDSGEWGWSGLEEAGGGGPRVPAIVSACLAHLRRHGLHTVGLFRVSSSKKRVRQLREEWERSQEAALDSAVCPHDVATLLKEFLRDLPDPLLCRDLYPAFLQTRKIHPRHKWEALRLIIQLLPAAHRDTLNALLSFLGQLSSHAEDGHQPGNKMDATNLATIFAPNILHKNKPNEAASQDQMSERSDVINVVQELMERQAELWTLPAEMLHEAYIHLVHNTPAHLDPLLLRRAECAAEQASAAAAVCAGAAPEGGGLRRVWSRETFLHGAAATGGANHPPSTRRSEKSYSRRRTRDAASDTSSGSVSSAMTIVTRVRSSEECGSSGVVCGSSPAARTDSAPESNDSASDYNDTLGGSDDDHVYKVSLHIPAAFSPASPRAPAAPPRRRSTSGSDSSKKDSIPGSRDSAVGSRDSAPGSRDSAVGSSSNASSPAASPPPPAAPAAPLRVTVTAGEVRRTTDIDRIMGLSRERNTSDARAVVLRQHDETTTAVRSRVSSRQEHSTRKEEHTVRREDQRREDTSKREEKREGTTLYKRGELISSARSPPT